MCEKNVDSLIEFFKSNHSFLTNEEIEVVKSAIRKRFLGNFSKRLKASKRNMEVFFKYHDCWLEIKLDFEILKVNKKKHFVDINYT